MTDAKVWKLRATEGAGWVESIDDSGPLVTADVDKAAEWADRSVVTAAANALNRARRGVQWRPVFVARTPGGPRRFDPTNPKVVSTSS